MHLNRHSLKVIRERSGLSITALATAAGLSQPHLTNLEAGKRQASPDAITKIAEALKVPVVALIDSDEPVEAGV